MIDREIESISISRIKIKGKFDLELVRVIIRRNGWEEFRLVFVRVREKHEKCHEKCKRACPL